MQIDGERAWLKFKRHILSKRSHGQGELLTEMARLEVECDLDVDPPEGDGETERGKPLPEGDTSPSGMPSRPTPLAPEEEAHGHRDEGRPGAFRNGAGHAVRA